MDTEPPEAPQGVSCLELELQLFDLVAFPDLPISDPQIRERRFVAGERMKSGSMRRNNAITYTKSYSRQSDIRDCVQDFLLFVTRSVPVDIKASTGARQAFVRLHLPPQDELTRDFNLPVDVLKQITTYDLSLDVWFRR